MIEFLIFVFTVPIALFTVLLGLVLVYWMFVIIGMLDLDFLNIDTDFDLDVEGDLDLDVDGEIDADAFGSAGGPFAALLTFFYVGKIPVMILVTMLSFTMWALAVLANAWLNPSGGALLGLPLAGGVIVASLFVVKIVGWPIGRLFEALNSQAADKQIKIVGSLCEVLTTTTSERLGQAEIRTNGSPITLNVLTENDKTMNRGDEAVVVEFRKARNVYIVAPVELES